MLSEEATRNRADEYVAAFTELADAAETAARLLHDYSRG